MTTTAPVLAPLPGISTPIGTARRGGAEAVGADRLAPAGGQARVGGPAADGALPGRAAPGPQAPGSQASGSQATGDAPPLRPGRPLIGGGPFTLSVALGLAADQFRQGPAGGSTGAGTANAPAGEGASSQSGSGSGGLNELTEEEERVVRELQARDREVRAHEAAHAAAGGAYAGAPTYTYQRGPDGRQYAVGGSVSIDTSPVQGDPAATIQKAQQIKRAALAPAEPSAQDRSVASQAQQEKLKAQREVAQGKDANDPLTPKVEGPEPASDDGARADSTVVATNGHLGHAQKTPTAPTISLIA